VWVPDVETERRRRLVARRNEVVRHRTRVKNEIHAVLAVHLVPPCPHAELFNGPGRAWLAKQVLPDDERATIERHLRELDRLGEDLAELDREIGAAVVDDPVVKGLLTIAGVNVTVAAGLVAAIGDIKRFPSPQKLVSYFGLNPRVRQSGLGLAQHGRISKVGRAHARALLVEAAPPPPIGRVPFRDRSITSWPSMGGGEGSRSLVHLLCPLPRPPWSPGRGRGPPHAACRAGTPVATARKMAVLVWHRHRAPQQMRVDRLIAGKMLARDQRRG
jgi:hypothetical protein